MGNKNKELLKACQKGDLDAVKASFKSYTSEFWANKDAADVNCVDSEGNTPLILVTQGQFRNIIEHLLARGADPQVKNKKGESALSIAKSAKMTALLTACQGTDIEPVKAALNDNYGGLIAADEVVKSCVNCCWISDGNTPLILATTMRSWDIVEYLLQNGADPKAKNKKGETALSIALANKRTALLSACQEKDLSAVKAPLQNNCGGLFTCDELVKFCINTYFPADGNTPLLWAASKGYKGTIEYLLQNGADPEAKNVQGETALGIATGRRNRGLLTACQSNDLEAVKAAFKESYGGLLKESSFTASVNYADSDGNTPLIHAASRGYKNIIEYLLQNGADTQLRNKKDETALTAAIVHKNKTLVAACLGNDPETVKNTLKNNYGGLFAQGHEVVAANSIDSDGNTPLMLAASRGFRGIVQHLLQNGADPGIKNKLGQTVLMFAAKGGYKDIMADLIAANKGTAGASASKEAVVQKPDVAALLAERDNEGLSVLRYAVDNQQSMAVLFLLEQDVPVDDKCNKGMTALMMAAFGGDCVSLQALLDKNADIDARDSKNKTALMFATANDKRRAVEELLNRGAKTDLKSNDGKVAQEMGSSETVKMIQAYLADKAKAASQEEALRAAIRKEGFDPDQKERWVPVGDVAIDRIVTSPDSPKLLSNLFNFESGQYVLTVKNLLTAESESTNGSLKSFPNQDLLVTAREKLVALGKNPPAYAPNKFAI